MNPQQPDQKRPSGFECDCRIVRNCKEIGETNYYTQKCEPQNLIRQWLKSVQGYGGCPPGID